MLSSSGLPRFHDYRNLITITTMGECNGNTPWRLVGSQDSTDSVTVVTVLDEQKNMVGAARRDQTI